MKKLTTLVLLLGIYCANAMGQVANLPGKAGKIVVVEKEYPGSRIDGYTLYLPQSYERLDKQFAVLFFLHGGLGVGGEVEKVNEQPLPEMLLQETDMSLERNQCLLDSFVVVSPHMEEGQFYQNESAFRAMVKEILASYETDPKRVYITGLSRGGHGTWGLADRMWDVFAAAVPIAGGNHGVESPVNLSKLPIWAIHNTDDRVVGYRGSKEAVEAIEQDSEVSFLRYTQIEPHTSNYLDHTHIFTSPTVGDPDSRAHDAWTPAYNMAALYKWLLRQHK